MKAKFEVNGETVTITTSMETLNEIIRMANYCKEKGYEDASKIYDDWFRGIYDALDAKGFYDDVKEQ